MDYYHSKDTSDSEFPLQPLINHFCSFKGIGQKTSQRLAFELISFPKDKVASFSAALLKTKEAIKYCSTCYYLSLESTCNICSNINRNHQSICVVSEPKDVLAIEQSKTFKGAYHVLGGLISPLDGMYPEMLRCKELVKRVSEQQVNEVILGLSPTVEGDTTGLYIQDLLESFDVKLYKLAQGIPIGADLAYLDEVTIDKAFKGMLKL